MTPSRFPKEITISVPQIPKMPKAPASKVDRLYELREARLAFGRAIGEAEKLLSRIKEVEEEIALELSAELRKLGGATKLSGEVATFAPSTTPVYAVADWDAFYAHIKKNDAWDLLERRPARAALNARFDEHKAVPGIQQDRKFSYSLTKASR